MPQGRKNVKKPQSSKQRKGSTASSSTNDVSQPNRSKRVQITELSEDTGEREISEESAAVQDMDAAAETSEMALSEAEGGLDGDGGQDKGTKRVDDIVTVILSETTQKLLNCVVGEHLFVDKTWCNVPKKAILEDIANQKEASSFFPFSKDIEAYNEEEFLIGYTPFEEVENCFLFCVTVRGRASILDKLFNIRSSYMQRITKLKSVRPGAWQSHGSEKEVEAANVHNERPLLSFEWLTKLSLRNTGQPTFSDMAAGVEKSSVVHCLPTTKGLQGMNLIIRKSQDVAVQAVRPTAKKCVQTIPQIPTNVAVQCVSQADITEEAKKHTPAITDDQLNLFFEKYSEYLLKSLRYNELYDLYHDDYPSLSKRGTKFLAAPIDVYKQYQSFTDVGAIEGKLIVSVSWSTKYTGVFAVAYADEVPCKLRIVESDSDDTDCEDEKSDNYEATKGTKTKGKEGSGEGEWLEEEAAWKKERQDVQDMSAYSKSQAKLQQLELARITQVFEVEEYKKFIKRKEKYSEEWIENRMRKKQNGKRAPIKSKIKFSNRGGIIGQKPLNKSLADNSQDGLKVSTDGTSPTDEQSTPEGNELNMAQEDERNGSQLEAITKRSVNWL